MAHNNPRPILWWEVWLVTALLLGSLLNLAYQLVVGGPV